MVSIVIPVYNDERYIQESVESALNQDYENLEVIVVDDGSTDATPEILKEFGERIRYIRQENQGTAAALNNGIRHAKGSLIAWLSSDDLFLPGKIKHQVRKFQEEPFLALVYTDWIMIDSQGRELKVVRSPCPPPESFAIEMLRGNFINGSSVLIRRDCFEKVGYFDEALLTDSDGDMWFRLLENGCRFGHVPTPLTKYRWHSGNLSHRYKLHQTCKDQVRSRALQAFSAQELFGDLLEKKRIGVDLAYERLAFTLARQFLFRAASAAMKTSMQNRFSLKRTILLVSFKLMSTRLVLWALLPARQIRGRIKKWWLIKREAKGSKSVRNI